MIQPLNDNVVVKIEREEEKRTDSGLVLADTTTKLQEEAEVVAVGPGKVLDNGQRRAMDVKVGDTIIFKSYHLEELKFGEEEFGVIQIGDVIGVKNV